MNYFLIFCCNKPCFYGNYASVVDACQFSFNIYIFIFESTVHLKNALERQSGLVSNKTV